MGVVIRVTSCHSKQSADPDGTYSQQTQDPPDTEGSAPSKHGGHRGLDILMSWELEAGKGPTIFWGLKNPGALNIPVTPDIAKTGMRAKL